MPTSLGCGPGRHMERRQFPNPIQPFKRQVFSEAGQYPKSVRQAQRQAEVARQHGVRVRWEVPKDKVNAAKDLVKRANAEDVIEVVGVDR